MKRNFLNKIVIGVFAGSLAISCTPDRADGDGNGLTPGNLDATFAVTETSANHYKLTPKDQSYLFSKWDLGDGAGFYKGKMIEDIFIPLITI